MLVLLEIQLVPGTRTSDFLTPEDYMLLQSNYSSFNKIMISMYRMLDSNYNMISSKLLNILKPDSIQSLQCQDFIIDDD